MKDPALVLASASPRRVELLRLLGIPFRVEASAVGEVASEHLAPHEICLANAASKARAVSKLFPQDLVLGADTEVALGTRVLGKPRTLDEAAAFLKVLSGCTHQVITGVCLLCADRQYRRSFSETTHVTFHSLSDNRIANYLGRVDPLDKAGGYAVQESGELIVESIEGSFSNVVGLPLAALRDSLAQLPATWRIGPPK